MPDETTGAQDPARPAWSRRSRGKCAKLAHPDPSVVEAKSCYFRAVPGGYAEGDRFLGVRILDRVAQHGARHGQVMAITEGVQQATLSGEQPRPRDVERA